MVLLNVRLRYEQDRLFGVTRVLMQGQIFTALYVDTVPSHLRLNELPFVYDEIMREVHL